MIENWLKNISLKTYNTFGINVNATYFLKTDNASKIIESGLYCYENQIPFLILGGGSNILFTQDFDGLVIINETKGIEIISENEYEVRLKVASGEVWHQLVMFCVDKGFGGIENLSLIPGSVGAAPIQNIGAYGIEIKEVIETVTYYNFEEKKLRNITHHECDFAYRNSIFKQKLKGKIFITEIQICLKKQGKLNMNYGDIRQVIEENLIAEPTIKDISNAVIQIRQSKLPDPAKLGNAGSFFKNPEVPKKIYESLQKKYPLIPGYVMSENIIKIPAGWLIEQCEWKGKRVGNTGNHIKQALVIVNYDNATGAEIWNHANNVIESVKEKFGIELEAEVNVV